MAFGDSANSRTILEGFLPLKNVTLTGTVKTGDLVGYSSGWVQADGDNSIYAELIAGQHGVSGDKITCYRIARIGGITTGTAGNTLYLSDTVGGYGASAGTVSQRVGFELGNSEMLIEPKNIVLVRAEQVTLADIEDLAENALIVGNASSRPTADTTPTLNNAVAKGTWTASETWAIPAVTLRGTLTCSTTTLVARDVSNSYFNVYAGTTAGGAGIRLVLFGKTGASPGAFKLYTPNAAGDADTLRLTVTGVLATAVASWSAITHTGLVITDTASIDTGSASADYYTLKAFDTGGSLVEIARISGAAEPWIGLGKDSDVVKATYDDKLGFYSATPVTQASHITDTGGDDATAVNAILVVLENLGLVAASA